mmetsp:Transcript_6467/g.13499  ORF Transcript_6467/g.13499 Transcript_6467/m.13499 type:complete len:457 (-) Transcript_6467:1067-2437(-)
MSGGATLPRFPRLAGAGGLEGPGGGPPGGRRGAAQSPPPQSPSPPRAPPSQPPAAARGPLGGTGRPHTAAGDARAGVDDARGGGRGNAEGEGGPLPVLAGGGADGGRPRVVQAPVPVVRAPHGRPAHFAVRGRRGGRTPGRAYFLRGSVRLAPGFPVRGRRRQRQRRRREGGGAILLLRLVVPPRRMPLVRRVLSIRPRRGQKYGQIHGPVRGRGSQDIAGIGEVRGDAPGRVGQNLRVEGTHPVRQRDTRHHTHVVGRFEQALLPRPRRQQIDGDRPRLRSRHGIPIPQRQRPRRAGSGTVPRRRRRSAGGTRTQASLGGPQRSERRDTEGDRQVRAPGIPDTVREFFVLRDTGHGVGIEAVEVLRRVVQRTERVHTGRSVRPGVAGSSVPHVQLPVGAHIVPHLRPGGPGVPLARQEQAFGDRAPGDVVPDTHEEHVAAGERVEGFGARGTVRP